MSGAPIEPFNTPLFVGVGIVVSVLSNSAFSRGIGDVSCQYETRFSPSSTAFAIWGPIYLFCTFSVLEQVRWREVESSTYNETVSNIAHGLAWMFAALWTPAFTTTVLKDDRLVPQRPTIFLAAAFLVLTAVSSLVAVIASSSWKVQNTKWVTGVGISLLSGWTLLAAAINVAIAYKVFTDKQATSCDTDIEDEEDYTIFSALDPKYFTSIPLLLSTLPMVVAIFFRNPVVLLPSLWAIIFMRPSFYNYFAVILLIVAEIIALIRTFS